MLYLNRAQICVLALLREYGALKKSQLEVMARHEVSGYLENLNGYLTQLYYGREVEILPCGKKDAYVCLPGMEPDEDMIAAFDVPAALFGRVRGHKRGAGPTQIAFGLEAGDGRIREAYVLFVHTGREKAAAEYADAHLSGGFKTVFFLCGRQSQMKDITAACNHIFAVSVKGEIRFFEGY